MSDVIQARHRSNLRRAWCELTGGHVRDLLIARQEGVPWGVAFVCERCHAHSRWYRLPAPPSTEDLSQRAIGDEGDLP